MVLQPSSGSFDSSSLPLPLRKLRVRALGVAQDDKLLSVSLIKMLGVGNNQR